jgi:hypothetical protein
MGKKPKESRYAALLRGLGFKPYAELLSSEDFAETESVRIRLEQAAERGLNRAQRRKLRALGADPVFFKSESYTYAKDETGADWAIEKPVDLAPYGFTDGSAGTFKIYH